MNVQFFFDPCCPFCWITSRWLLMVQPERDLKIEWKQFSLALKNGSLEGKDKTGIAEEHIAAHRIQRVILAASKLGASKINLYTAFASPYHLDNKKFDNELIKKVLEQQSLPASLIKSADDISFDTELQESLGEATSVAGQDIGTPTIIFELKDGSKSGFFGPVLQTLPDKTDALKLWDGLSQLASDKNFYELKRSRPSGKPDTGSTAVCQLDLS